MQLRLIHDGTLRFTLSGSFSHLRCLKWKIFNYYKFHISEIVLSCLVPSSNSKFI